MKLSYIILAHDRPEQAAELARVMTHNRADAYAYVHFDAKAPAELFSRLEAAVGEQPRTNLVAPRVATGWGAFGLVSAVINAFRQVKQAGIEPDYVVLLSGADLPVRPSAQLERFLREQKGREFIESYDENWIVDGLRAARYQLFFPFNMRKHPHLHRWSTALQKGLGVRRRFPTGLRPRFGSQWWALSWPTCSAILDYIDRNPRNYRFFRHVWIPDEMFFQTMVDRLVARKWIAGYGLTHYQFSDKGKPVVFHDDHGDYVLGLDKFFVRKCNPAAEELRVKCFEAAAAKDDGQPLTPGRDRSSDYADKIAAQTYYPVYGQLYYRDQYADCAYEMLSQPTLPLVVLAGMPDVVRAVMERLDGGPFTVVGEPFAHGSVDLYRSKQAFAGLRHDDRAIRDMHPGLYLQRILTRCTGVPVLAWTKGSDPGMFGCLQKNPNVTLVTCLPMTFDRSLDEAITYGTAVPEADLHSLNRIVPVAGEAKALTRARRDRLRQESWWATALSRLLFARSQLPQIGAGGTPAAVHFPFAIGPGAYRPEDQEAVFDQSVACAIGSWRPWFGDLVEALRAFGHQGAWTGDLNAILSSASRQRIEQYAPALDPNASGLFPATEYRSKSIA